MSFDDLDDDDEDFEELSEDELIQKIPEFNSVKLCDVIVAHRYLGFYKKMHIACMEELAKRRIDGDEFDFEKYIEETFNDLPKISFNLNDVNSALEQLKKMSNRR